MTATPRVVSTKRFDRSYRRYVGRDRVRRERVDAALRRLAADVNEPGLRTHPLAGELADTMACSCGYDCRIVFRVDTNAKDKTREIILLNVGTHDEVY